MLLRLNRVFPPVVRPAAVIRLPYTLQSGEKAGNLYSMYVDDRGKVTWLVKSI